MSETPATEWKRGWPLPFIGMLGMTGPSALAYSSGVFMEPVTKAFGWSNTQFSSLMFLQMTLGLVIGPLAGRLVDRFGPRKMVLIGSLPFAFALGMLGLANGQMWQWWLLGALYVPLSMGVHPASWVTGTLTGFQASRGLALSVVLAGIGLANMLWPIIAAGLIGSIGWRLAFPAMAAGWALLVFPLVVMFFFPVQPDPVEEAASDKPPVAPALRSRIFLCLLAAGGLFACVQFALNLHFVQIARHQGLTMTTAASIAGLIGLFSILGRIATGYLLDRLPTRPLALVAFSLPLVVMALLASAGGSIPILMAAAVLLGFAAGSETDIVTYLASRTIDQRIFGTVYAFIQAGFSILAASGPLIASKVLDMTGGYDRFYVIAVPILLVSTGLILLVPRAGRGEPSLKTSAP
jgi:MFS family permease